MYNQKDNKKSVESKVGSWRSTIKEKTSGKTDKDKRKGDILMTRMEEVTFLVFCCSWYN